MVRLRLLDAEDLFQILELRALALFLLFAARRAFCFLRNRTHRVLRHHRAERYVDAAFAVFLQQPALLTPALRDVVDLHGRPRHCAEQRGERRARQQHDRADEQNHDQDPRADDADGRGQRRAEHSADQSRAAGFHAARVKIADRLKKAHALRQRGVAEKMHRRAPEEQNQAYEHHPRPAVQPGLLERLRHRDVKHQDREDQRPVAEKPAQHVMYEKPDIFAGNQHKARGEDRPEKPENRAALVALADLLDLRGLLLCFRRIRF